MRKKGCNFNFVFFLNFQKKFPPSQSKQNIKKPHPNGAKKIVLGYDGFAEAKKIFLLAYRYLSINMKSKIFSRLSGTGYGCLLNDLLNLLRDQKNDVAD